ncbi:Hypothetical_protein [Hexamita inflata]|uniref:Hypothetical_protein n=1 Tax=Hexamita inflata TaxID=28002 RepID=A0AA86R5U1_9EUKA|nr:Hypothetical protein HINF_LOCUS13239 [Hexamita inflata]CAI9966738.1 Hypothetical protein HINF_LOCUS54383 [Hexamita inflata]
MYSVYIWQKKKEILVFSKQFQKMYFNSFSLPLPLLETIIYLCESRIPKSEIKNFLTFSLNSILFIRCKYFINYNSICQQIALSSQKSPKQTLADQKSYCKRHESIWQQGMPMYILNSCQQEKQDYRKRRAGTDCVINIFSNYLPLLVFSFMRAVSTSNVWQPSVFKRLILKVEIQMAFIGYDSQLVFS